MPKFQIFTPQMPPTAKWGPGRRPSLTFFPPLLDNTPLLNAMVTIATRLQSQESRAVAWSQSRGSCNRCITKQYKSVPALAEKVIVGLASHGHAYNRRRSDHCHRRGDEHPTYTLHLEYTFSVHMLRTQGTLYKVAQIKITAVNLQKYWQSFRILLRNLHSR